MPRYLILDEHEKPLPGQEPYSDFCDVLEAARALEGRNIVVRDDNGTYVPLAYQGPNGWNPRRKKGVTT